MELRRREGEWILNNPCVNKAVAGRTKKEQEELHKEHNFNNFSQLNWDDRNKNWEYKNPCCVVDTTHVVI